VHAAGTMRNWLSQLFRSEMQAWTRAVLARYAREAFRFFALTYWDSYAFTTSLPCSFSAALDVGSGIRVNFSLVAGPSSIAICC